MSRTVECDLCGQTMLFQDAIESANEDGEIIYICKECAEEEDE